MGIILDTPIDMRNLKFISILFIVTFILSITTLAQTYEANFSTRITLPVETGMNFLAKMGYVNYGAKASETYEELKDKNTHPVTLLALSNAAPAFAGLHSSFILGSLYYSFLTLNAKLPVDQQSKNLQIMLNMATQQIMPFPALGLEPIQDVRYQANRGEIALKIREQYLQKRGVDRHLLEKTNLIKAFTYLYKQLEIKERINVANFQGWLDIHLQEILHHQYSLQLQNRYFGRAMVLATVKFARDSQNAIIEEKLKNQLRSVEIDLDNLVNARYQTKTLDRKNSIYQMKNGDIALEFSSGQEAYFTSMGVEPTNPENAALAKKLQITSSYSNLPMFAAEKNYSAALKRKRSNLFLNEDQESMISSYWDANISKGYSHAGMVQVKTDDTTKISVAWIWDIFPNTRGGGIRLMTPEGFSHPNEFLRIGFARYSPVKILATFKKQFAERGYLTNVMESFESYLDFSERKTGKGEADKTKKIMRVTHISKNDMFSLVANVKDADAEQWYQNTILPLVFDQIEKYIYSEDAMIFAKNLINANGMAYCSQMIRLAYLQSTNFDPAPTSDKYRSLPLMLAKYFPDDLSLRGEKFISPAGLVWQANVLEQHIILDFDRSSVERQEKSRTFADHFANYAGRSNEVTSENILVELEQYELDEIAIDEQ